MSSKVAILLALAATAMAVGPYQRPTYTPKYPTYSAPEPEPEPEPYQRPAPVKYVEPKYPVTYPASQPSYCDPKVVPKCAYNSSMGVCETDYEYPHKEVQAALLNEKLLARKFSDVKDQSADDLVEYVTKHQEDAFDYSHYRGPWDKGNWVGPEGYICPSQVGYIRPLRAVNVEGYWRVIVNDPSHCTQTQRVERCLAPDNACRTLAPCYKSKCLQKYTYHRLLSFDPCEPYRGLFIDTYKLPSACSCHVPTKAY